MNTSKKNISGLACSAVEMLNNHFGDSGEKVINLAPASLILLGDHTHYNDGNIITGAIDRFVCVVVSKNAKNEIRIITEDSEDPVIFSLDLETQGQLKFPFNRVLKIVEFVKSSGLLNTGLDFSITSNVPEGVGLGHCSAVTIALLNAVNKILKLNIERETFLDVAYKVELGIVGKITNKALLVASAKNQKDMIMNFDFRSKEVLNFDFDRNKYSILLCDTHKENLKNSLCEERISECEVGVKGLRLYIWGIKNLRDVNLDFLEKHVHMLPRRVYKRCYYNVTERIRVDKALEFLQKDELEKFSGILNDSHWGLSTDYEISTEDHDFLVDSSSELKGVIGSKLISCSPKLLTVHIIKKENEFEIIDELKCAYFKKYGTEVNFHIANLTRGSFLINSDEVL